MLQSGTAHHQICEPDVGQWPQPRLRSFEVRIPRKCWISHWFGFKPMPTSSLSDPYIIYARVRYLSSCLKPLCYTVLSYSILKKQILPCSQVSADPLALFSNDRLFLLKWEKGSIERGNMYFAYIRCHNRGLVILLSMYAWSWFLKIMQLSIDSSWSS